MTALLLRRLARPLVRGSRSFACEHGKIGFIGLGQMGSRMANNLLKQGHEVIAYDLNDAALQAAVAAGAKVAASAAAVASEAQTVITMLPENEHVRAVYFGKEGVLSGDVAGRFLIDCSTCAPAVSQEVAAEATAKGAAFIDAPVSGGVGGAEAATLTFLVGGKAEHYETAVGLLEHMGAKIFHCGDHGMGQAAKLCNNLVLGISMAAVAEGHAMAGRLGLDPKKYAEIVNTSSGRCWSSDTYNPCPGVMPGLPASNGYEGGFACDFMKKDLNLIMGAASGLKPQQAMPMGAAALQLYALASTAGYGRKDFGVIYKMLTNS